MASTSDGISSPAIEQDPSIAQIQAAQLGAQQAIAVALPAVGFVASIDGLSGLLTFADGANILITNDGVGNFTFSVTGLSTSATVLNHIDTVPPNAGNDSTQGFAIWSLWLDTSGPTIYQCASAAPSAAVWLQISN